MCTVSIAIGINLIHTPSAGLSKNYKQNLHIVVGTQIWPLGKKVTHVKLLTIKTAVLSFFSNFFKSAKYNIK